MPKLSPALTKQIGVLTFWFYTQVEHLEIYIEHGDTSMQLGDQFTESLPADLLLLLRKRCLMG